jgi:signal transduction histidine kinase
LLRSSTFRLALVYMLLFGGSVLLLLSFIYWSTARQMSAQADGTIEAEISGLAERYRIAGLSGLVRLVGERVSRRPAGNAVYLLLDRAGRPLAGNLRSWPGEAADPDGWLDFRLRGANWEEREVHPARARVFQLSGGFRLLVGRDLVELELARSRIVRALAWGLAMTAVLGLAGGAMMSRSVLRRIELINQTSRRIMSGELGRRIPRDQSGDDFDVLAANLNLMLERIETLMEEVRRVSVNVAHDLRTPLGRLRNSLEMLRDRQPGSDSRGQVEQAIAEADGLLATFNALLRIARIEARARRAGFDRVDVQALARDVVELYEPLAEERGQKLVLRGAASAAVVPGDRDLLFQALANLLDNAIKYTTAGGLVEISVAARPGAVELAVSDTGPGIPASERRKVFERFYRLESSRETPGNGLGLSLVEAVARLHDATIELADNRPGLRVLMRLSSEAGSPPPPAD